MCFADADHAGDPDTKRSTTTGYVGMVNGIAVSWQSTLQLVSALRTAVAECYAASVVGADVVYLLLWLLQERGH